MPTADFICLANSYKLNHRYVAGLRLDGEGWIRPVSDKPGGELTYSQYRLPGDSEQLLLDVIRVGPAKPTPLLYQPENWLIDGSAWQLLERAGRGDVLRCGGRVVATRSFLFGDPGRSVPEAHLQKGAMPASLALVRPGMVRWRKEFNSFVGRNRQRVLFRRGEVEYDLPLTHPAFMSRLAAAGRRRVWRG